MKIYSTTTIDDIPERQSRIRDAAPRVYDAMGRMPIDGEPGQGLLNGQAANVIINETVTGKIAETTPRYRGITNIPDLDNTGIINSQEMNLGDFIMYNGEPEGIWIPNKMYEWVRDGWRFLSIEENRWRYLDGVNDLTDGAIDGVFGNAFINTLITKTAIIEKLFAELIVMSGNGVIQSEGFQGAGGEVNGFSLTARNGALEAVNAIFRNITILGHSQFNGDITSGALISNNQDVPDFPPKTFNAGQTALDVFNYLGEGLHPITSGSFGGQDGIIAIRCYMDSVYISGVQFGSWIPRYNIEIRIIDAGYITRSWADASGHRNTLGSILTLNGGRGGKTFILTGIPSNPNVGVG